MLKELLLVVSIIDGDTIKVLDHNNHQLKVRLANIDAPERKQPYGRVSSKTLADMIGNQYVNLECPNKDRYNRWICSITFQGIDINKAMVEYGSAWVYRRYYSGTEYIEAEEFAKTHNLGLWSLSEYEKIPPWQWRKMNK